MDRGVGDHGSLGPLVAHEPVEAGLGRRVAELFEDLEGDGLAEDAPDLTVVEAHVLHAVQREAVLCLVHVQGDVGDGGVLPRHAGRLSGDVELHGSVAGDLAAVEGVVLRVARATVDDDEVVRQGDVRVVADLVQVAAPAPRLVLPVLVGLGDDGRIHREVEHVAVAPEDVDAHVGDFGVGGGRPEVVVDGGGARVVRTRVRGDVVVVGDVLVHDGGRGTGDEGGDQEQREQDGTHGDLSFCLAAGVALWPFVRYNAWLSTSFPNSPV